MNAQPQNPQHNVDAQEIAKFEAVASRWWDLEGEFKPLHRINPLRLGYIAQHSHGLFGKKKCSMSAVVAVSWRKALPGKVQSSPGWIWARSHLKWHDCMRWRAA